jgi:hypothetical protein
MFVINIQVFANFPEIRITLKSHPAGTAYELRGLRRM